MGMILLVSRRFVVSAESENIYPWPDMSADEIFLSRRIRWFIGNSRKNKEKIEEKEKEEN